MSSDFAIAQFHFLERLLLVHGHWCYRRIALMVNYENEHEFEDRWNIVAASCGVTLYSNGCRYATSFTRTLLLGLHCFGMRPILPSLAKLLIMIGTYHSTMSSSLLFLWLHLACLIKMFLLVFASRSPNLMSSQSSNISMFSFNMYQSHCICIITVSCLISRRCSKHALRLAPNTWLDGPWSYKLSDHLLRHSQFCHQSSLSKRRPSGWLWGSWSDNVLLRCMGSKLPNGTLH